MAKEPKSGFYISDIPTYNGAGIYALIDERGKKYIGSSLHIAHRVRTHQKNLRLALNGHSTSFEPPQIENAVLSGIKLKSEILFKCKNGTSSDVLRKIEGFYVALFGGTSKTYNVIMPTSNYFKKANDLIEFMETQ